MLHDLEPLYDVAKDPLIWQQHPCRDRYKEEVYSEFFKESLNSKGALIVIDKSNNKIIGSTRFKPVKDIHTAIEIGWSFLSRDYWGGTFNKSMKRLMIDYAFEMVEDIIFYISRDNIRSQKAVEKIGAKIILEVDAQPFMSENQDNLTYRVNRREWKT
jgi:RimJ/RimL family protein N-acetyltransferase